MTAVPGPPRGSRRALPPAPASGSHDALVYGSDEEFVDVALRHLDTGARQGEALLVACSEDRAKLVIDAIDDASTVSVLGNDGTYQTPWSALESFLDATHQAVAAGATGLRVVGELPPGTHEHPHTWPGWSRYEAVANEILATLPCHALCTYDARETDASLLQTVRETHPHTWQGGERHANPHYREPADCLRRWSDPAVLPIERSAPLLEVPGIREPLDARRARHRVGDLLALHDTALLPHAALLPPTDPMQVETSEYLLGIDEVLINALVHGGRPATLRLWADHDRVITTVTDSGAGFDDPYVGYTTRRALSIPDEATRPELGLWLARQMCDDLSFRHDDEGFTVRLRADLDVRFD